MVFFSFERVSKDMDIVHFQRRRNSIISGEAAQVTERTGAGNFKKLL